MKSNPLVSIGLPVFNSETDIRSVIGSILGQDYRNFELIISDDESTDGSYGICKEYADKDPRIKLFKQEKNIGMLRNFEFVFEKSQGEYFMWAGHDDWWDNRFIVKLKDALDRNPNYGLAMSSIRHVYEDGSFFGEVIYSGKNDLTKFGYMKAFNAAVWKNPPVHFLYYGLFKMEVMKKLMWKPFSDTIAHDKIFFYEAALSVHFYTLQDILWKKTTYRKAYFERYSQDTKKMFLDKKGYLRYLWAAIIRLTLSPNIPWYRKLFLPYIISSIIWAEKKNLFREIFPAGFRLAKGFKKRLKQEETL